MGSIPMEVGWFRWARLWVGDVDVGLLCGLAMSVWVGDDTDGDEDNGFGV